MKTSELRAKTVEELQLELQGLLREQFNLRMQKGLRELPTAHGVRNVRRGIARVKTVLCEKQRDNV